MPLERSTHATDMSSPTAPVKNGESSSSHLPGESSTTDSSHVCRSIAERDARSSRRPCPDAHFDDASLRRDDHDRARRSIDRDEVVVLAKLRLQLVQRAGNAAHRSRESRARPTARAARRRHRRRRCTPTRRARRRRANSDARIITIGAPASDGSGKHRTSCPPLRAPRRRRAACRAARRPCLSAVER